MPVAHITVHSEATVTRIIDWCNDNDHNGVEYYVVPKPASSNRNPAERVVVTTTQEGLDILKSYLDVNNVKTEWEVDSE